MLWGSEVDLSEVSNAVAEDESEDQGDGSLAPSLRSSRAEFF